MAKKKTKKEEPLRLIRWADDGFPPIDLSKEAKSVLELIKEVRELREENKRLRRSNNYYRYGQ
jgi:hypothetical protein